MSYLRDLIKIIRLGIIERKIEKLTKEKNRLISGFSDINLLPPKYRHFSNVNIKTRYSFSEYKEGIDLKIAVHQSTTGENQSVSSNVNQPEASTPQTDNIISIENKNDVKTNEDNNEAIESKFVSQIPIRVVTIDLDKEVTFIQIMDETYLKNGNPNVVDIHAERKYLTKLTVGEHCELKLFNDGNVEFVLENGEVIAC